MQAPTQTQDKTHRLQPLYHFTVCMCLGSQVLRLRKICYNVFIFCFIISSFFLFFLEMTLFYSLWCVPRLCEHDLICLNDAGGSLIVMCLSAFLHIIIYWSYLSIYALLPWHVYQCVCVCVCVNLNTYTLVWISCSLVVWLPFSSIFSVSQDVFFFLFFHVAVFPLKHFSHLRSFPSQQHNQNE